ncbi:hypothetical protein Trydic_g17809 [Trypoxylus dichotomus]
MNLAEKVALVTGGLSGIGASCVEDFLKNGIKGIVVADINSAEEIIQNFNAKYGEGRVTFVKTDVSERESFANAFQKTVDTYNNIDILINAAGIIEQDDWQRVIQVNLVGPTLGCELAINTYFPKYKTGANAYIVNISSLAGIVPYRGAPYYAAAKHGLIGLTRSYGQNKVIIEQGIFVMALCPGRTDTAMENPTPLGKTLYGDQLLEDLFAVPCQKPEAVSKSIIEILGTPQHGSVWVTQASKLSKVKLLTYQTLMASS